MKTNNPEMDTPPGPEDDLNPGKLIQEDHIRLLLPHEMWTYIDGKLCVSVEGLACLCIGILEGKIEGNKSRAQQMLDQIGIRNPFDK